MSSQQESADYYLRGQDDLSPEHKQILENSMTEVDQHQIDIYQKLSSSERFSQGYSISDTARMVVAYRIRQEDSKLSLVEGLRQSFRNTYSTFATPTASL